MEQIAMITQVHRGLRIHLLYTVESCFYAAQPVGGFDELPTYLLRFD
jgi:hypothetical protein